MLHYAWPATVGNHSWAFNKHDMTGFRADACPSQRADGGNRGLFAHLPSPRLLRSQVRTAQGGQLFDVATDACESCCKRYVCLPCRLGSMCAIS